MREETDDRYSPERNDKVTESTLCHNRLYPGQNSKLAPLEFKSDVLPLWYP